MGIETIAAAKRIISKRIKMNAKDAVRAEGEYSEIMDRMEKIECQLAKLANFESKLDMLLQKLST